MPYWILKSKELQTLQMEQFSLSVKCHDAAVLLCCCCFQIWAEKCRNLQINIDESLNYVEMVQALQLF